MAGRSDVDVLEDLLALENRLISAYEAALRRDAIDVALGEMLRDHEQEHARAHRGGASPRRAALAARERAGARAHRGPPQP